MMYDATARLIAVTYEGTGIGTMERVETSSQIFCQIASVDRREFFAAYDSGLRAEFRVTTNPVNYSGQTIIDLDTADGPIRCDIYRTYRKNMDTLELWCVRKNEPAVQVFTLWAVGGKRVTLYGAYLSGADTNERTDTGTISIGTVTLILPQTLQAFVGEAAVAYTTPKRYAMMSPADQARHFAIDSSSFFTLGAIDPAMLFAPADCAGVLTDDGYLFASADIPANAKYQQINAVWDTWRVQSVGVKNTGKPDTEYIEVIGR